MKACQKCGIKAEDDDTYCPECGSKLKAIKESRNITVWTVLKIIAYIIVFITLINIFKINGIIAIVLLIIFLIWTNIINKILKKLFNTEISTGVKILVTIVLIFLSLSISQFSTSQLGSQIAVKQEFVRPVEKTQGHEFVERINKVINSKNYNELNMMFEKGDISDEVFKDINHILESRDYVNIRLSINSQSYHQNYAELMVSALFITDYEKKGEQTMWIFENINNKWILMSIKPRLSEVKLSRSFEQEATSKLRKIEGPIIAISKNGVSEQASW